jgi:hypothetical protein
MAYIPGGLSLKTSTLSGAGPREWNLQGTDAATAVRVSGYISDAQARGMQQGDIIEYFGWTTFTDQYNKTGPLTARHRFTVLEILASGAADLNDGLAEALTDTD